MSHCPAAEGRAKPLSFSFCPVGTKTQRCAPHWMRSKGQVAGWATQGSTRCGVGAVPTVGSLGPRCLGPRVSCALLGEVAALPHGFR